MRRIYVSLISSLDVGVWLRRHTLSCSLAEGLMKFVSDLLEAVGRDILAMRSQEVQLDVPSS